jgi:small ligand-binding sensory domain FIST
VPFAAALSEHPLATHAVGEVVGEVLDRLGGAPDVALLFVGAAHTGAVEDIATAVRALLGATVFAGCTTGTVVGVDREAEDAPAISLWAARLPRARAYRLTPQRTPEGTTILGLPSADQLEDMDALVVLTDPFSFPTFDLLDVWDAGGFDVPIVGGQASAARGPGGNRLLLNEEVHTDGAIAIALGGIATTAVVSQGCRPIGDPMIVTQGRGTLLEQLAGRPALERIEETVRALDPEDAERAQRGLQIGRVIDEQKLEFTRGDFLIRGLRGADRRTGAIAVDDEIDVGATVQLQVRDAASAELDLRELLAGHQAQSALLFTCNGRGTHLFGVEDRDAQIVGESVGRIPLAGMSCAGELGPVGGRSFLHTFTASVLLLSDHR